MAVDNINNINPVLPTTLLNQGKTSDPLATTPLNNVSNPVAVAVAAEQNLSPAQQAALLGAEALQILNAVPSAPADALLNNATNPDVATAIDALNLSATQQATLAGSAAFQALIAGQNLTPAQQAALAVNETLQTLTAPLTPLESTIPAATAAAGAQNPTLVATPVTNAAVTETTTGVVNPATPAAAATPVTTVTTATAVTTEELNPALSAATQPIPYSNAVAVYEVRNPTPEPPEPKPRAKEVLSPLPIGRARPVDRFVLRQEWEKRKVNMVRREDGRQKDFQSRPPLAEKSIRQMVGQANEDLAASGVPLHLVLVKNNEGYALDIYDCSDGEACRLSQEVALDLNKLMTILDDLQHEAGIIVDLKT